MRAECFLRNQLFAKYGHESGDLFAKDGKKGHLIDFFGP